MALPDDLYLHGWRRYVVVDVALHESAQIEASDAATGEGSCVDLSNLIAKIIVGEAWTKPKPKNGDQMGAC
jgi:hypothetical protein